MGVGGSETLPNDMLVLMVDVTVTETVMAVIFSASFCIRFFKTLRLTVDRSKKMDAFF